MPSPPLRGGTEPSDCSLGRGRKRDRRRPGGRSPIHQSWAGDHHRHSESLTVASRHSRATADLFSLLQIAVPGRDSASGSVGKRRRGDQRRASSSTDRSRCGRTDCHASGETWKVIPPGRGTRPVQSYGAKRSASPRRRHRTSSTSTMPTADSGSPIQRNASRIGTRSGCRVFSGSAAQNFSQPSLTAKTPRDCPAPAETRSIPRWAPGSGQGPHRPWTRLECPRSPAWANAKCAFHLINSRSDSQRARSARVRGDRSR